MAVRSPPASAARIAASSLASKSSALVDGVGFAAGSYFSGDLTSNFGLNSRFGTARSSGCFSIGVDAPRVSLSAADNMRSNASSSAALAGGDASTAGLFTGLFTNSTGASTSIATSSRALKSSSTFASPSPSEFASASSSPPLAFGGEFAKPPLAASIRPTSTPAASAAIARRSCASNNAFLSSS